MAQIKKNVPKKVKLNLSLSEEIKELLQRRADKNGITVSAYVSLLVVQDRFTDCC